MIKNLQAWDTTILLNGVTRTFLKMRGTTMCKLQNFYVIQILREIKIGESKRSKTAGFAIFEALKSESCW